MAMTYQEELTLHEVSSRLAIGDLTASYGRAYDKGDLETWVGNFVQTGVFELPDGRQLTGHKELTEFFEGAPHDMVHTTSDAVVRVDGVHATQVVQVVVYRSGEGEGADPVIRFVGTYSDELVYERGAWYFVRRVVTRDLL